MKRRGGYMRLLRGGVVLSRWRLCKLNINLHSQSNLITNEDLTPYLNPRFFNSAIKMSRWSPWIVTTGIWISSLYLTQLPGIRYKCILNYSNWHLNLLGSDSSSAKTNPTSRLILLIPGIIEFQLLNGENKMTIRDINERHAKRDKIERQEHGTIKTNGFFQ